MSTLYKLMAIIPLFLIMLIVYNAMAFFGVDFGVNATAIFFAPLPSGAEWAPTWGDVLIMTSVLILYFEIIKSTKTGTASIVEHGLSMVVFIACLMEFMLFDIAGTSTFLVITLMSLLDVVAGFNITIASARRDFTMGA
ncbi:hypothetical protein QUF74_18925 [Candidatus Halobeggiatoa sp. HSG11]|nr:hypothetical protein [Candidatus Halobeggiatoa sp. HSG11]